MTMMLCRNKVADFGKWKKAFDSHAHAHREAGLTLAHLWTNVEDPNEVFFIFSVADIHKAKAFTSAVSPEEATEKYGVVSGDYWFVEEVIERRTATESS